METSREIGKHGGRFIVGVRSDVEDASGHSGAFDRFHGFRKTRTGARGRRKLGSDAGGEDQKNERAERGLAHSQKWLCHIANFHWAPSAGGAANGHSLRSRDCTRKTARPKRITSNPHQMAFPVRRKSQIQPAIVSSAGNGYNHILNGRRSGGQRRRKSITPTAWPMNCMMSRMARTAAMAPRSLKSNAK